MTAEQRRADTPAERHLMVLVADGTAPDARVRRVDWILPPQAATNTT